MSLFIASLKTLATTFLSMLLFVWVAETGSDLQMTAVLLYAFFGGPILLGTFLVWGIPFHLLVRHFNIDYWYAYLVAGALPGPIFALVFLSLDKAEILIVGSCLAIMGSTCALLLWHWTREDQRTPSL